MLGVVLPLLGSASVASAQFTASVTGTVEDPTGAEVPGASITLTNTETQQTFTVISSSDGSYRFTTTPLVPVRS